MLLSIRLQANGECDITGEDSLNGALGLCLGAMAELDGGGSVTYDDNLSIEPGEVYCVVSWTEEENAFTVRSPNPFPQVRGLLEIARTLTGRKIFTPARPPLLMPAPGTLDLRNIGRDS
jgi:hypothetical protein